MHLLLCCVLIRLFNAKGLLPFNSVHTKTITAEHQKLQLCILFVPMESKHITKHPCV